MTNQSVLDFAPEGALGRVFRVDTGSVWAEALDHELLTRVAVGSLIAIQGANASEYLVGLLDRVTRDVYEDVDADEEGDLPEAKQRDLMRVVLVGTYRTVDGDRVNTFKRGADSYPLIDASCWAISGSNLQRLMGLLSQKVDPERRLNLGTFVADASAEAVADGDRLFQRHAALLGSTGSGKSWAVALILEKAKRLAHPNLIVFDMHGEYGPLTEDDNPIAKGFKVANSGIAEDDATEALNLPWWLLNQEEMQALLLDRSETNAPNQAARLSHHVRALKLKALEDERREDVIPHFTVDSPIPYSLSELLGALQADDEERVPGARAGADKGGPFFGTLSRFIARLRSRTEDRRYSFMFDPHSETNEYVWLHGFAEMLLSTDPGIKIVDFSEVPSDVLPVVVGVLARLLYEVHFWTDPEKRTPVTFVCDEAHLYLPETADGVVSQRAVEAFERIAKEGRKYGISLMIVSQRPSDVSRTVLSQCNNFIVLRLTNDQDQSLIRRLMPDSLGGITAALPLLDVGEAIVLGDAMVLPTRVRLHRPSVKPRSATMDFWTEWGTRKVKSDDLISAVEAMRKQSRLQIPREQATGTGTAESSQMTTIPNGG
jgi:hypothetical protein